MTKKSKIEPVGLDPRSLIGRPERIEISDDVLVRHDLIAKKQGVAVRTVDRGDAQGAPFIYIGGVKYRPERAYLEYLSNRIRRVGVTRQRRGR